MGVVPWMFVENPTAPNPHGREATVLEIQKQPDPVGDRILVHEDGNHGGHVTIWVNAEDLVLVYKEWHVRHAETGVEVRVTAEFEEDLMVFLATYFPKNDGTWIILST